MSSSLRLPLGSIIFLTCLALVVVLGSSLAAVGYAALDHLGKDMARAVVEKMVNSSACMTETIMQKTKFVSNALMMNVKVTSSSLYGQMGIPPEQLEYWGAYHSAHIISTDIIYEILIATDNGDAVILRHLETDIENIYPVEINVVQKASNLSKYILTKQFQLVHNVTRPLDPSNDIRNSDYWTDYVLSNESTCWVVHNVTRPLDPSNDIRNSDYWTDYVLSNESTCWVVHDHGHREKKGLLVAYHELINNVDGAIVGSIQTVVDATELIEQLNELKVGDTGSVYAMLYHPQKAFGDKRFAFFSHPANSRDMDHFTENNADPHVTSFLKEIDLSGSNIGIPQYRTWSDGSEMFSVGWMVLGGSGCGSELPPILIVLMAPLREFQKEADETKMQFLIVGLCVGIFSLFLSGALWLTVSSAVRPLTSAISMATQLRFESIKETRSVIFEFNKLSDALFYLTDRLSEYMKYLPDGVRAVAITEEVEIQSNIPPPQTDCVTIVFTDIQKSTFLWNTNPHAMSDALAKHNNLFRRKMLDFNGYEVKTIGDAFMIAFPTFEDAMSFCFEVQRSLIREDWMDELMDIELCSEKLSSENLIWRGLRVRMAVASGPVAWEKNPLTHRVEYFGATVMKAAAIESLACGGMVLTLADNVKECNRDVLEGCEQIPFPSQDLQEFGTVNLVAVYQKDLKGRSNEAYLQTKAWKEKQAKVKDLEATIASRTSGGGSSISASKAVSAKTKAEFGTKLIPCIGTVASFEMLPSEDNTMFDHLTTISYILEDAVDRCKATLIQVNGVRIDVAWNAAKKCTDHPLQAILFTARVYKESGSRQSLKIGMVTGQLLHGRVGSETKRFKSVLGTALNLALGLCTLCEKLGTKMLLAEAPGIPCAVHDPSLSSYHRLLLKLRTSNTTDLLSIHEVDVAALRKSNTWYTVADADTIFKPSGLSDAVHLASTSTDTAALVSICEYIPLDVPLGAALALFKTWNGETPRVLPHEDPAYTLGSLPMDIETNVPAMHWY
eukprot:TRINITY_DN3555_c1_g1_i1.p1 TRINITY_DN3555_c1_g1~~TRINITY_DN3555_c1_g1_i1.p1  ORF type:complete len:1032 (+),score=131.90 TRINITY_DN3555_c1_g1_i1:61-3096(+)